MDWIRRNVVVWASCLVIIMSLFTDLQILQFKCYKWILIAEEKLS